MKTRIKETIKNKTDDIYCEYAEDVDKVTFAFNMISRNMEDKETLAELFHSVYMSNDCEALGTLIYNLIEADIYREAGEAAQQQVEESLDILRGYHD